MTHPRISEIVRELDAARAELHAVVGALPEEVKRAAPPSDGWSVAQILEHLSLVEDGSGRIVSNLIKEVAGAGAQESSTESVLGFNDRFAIATSDVRVTAPERIRPTQGLTVEESISRLEASRARLKAALEGASGLALEQATFPHPLFGPFNGYQWALATAQHERRHIRQIRRLTGLSSS